MIIDHFGRHIRSLICTIVQTRVNVQYYIADLLHTFAAFLNESTLEVEQIVSTRKLTVTEMAAGSSVWGQKETCRRFWNEAIYRYR